MANEGLTQIRNLWQTQLTADVSSSATTLPVVTTSGMPTSGIAWMGREAVYYTGLTGTSFTGCTRGFDGTTATLHGKGGRVESRVTAAHHNDVLTFISNSKRRLAYVGGVLANGSAISASTETTLLDNQSFTVNAANSLIFVAVRLGVQVDFTSGGGLVTAGARIQSAAGATQSGTLYRLGTARVQVSGEFGTPPGGVFVFQAGAAATHTVKVTLLAEQSGLVYCRNTSTEFLEVDVIEVPAI